MTDHAKRLEFAIDLARRAGSVAAQFFKSIDSLKIESKGHQDLVSNADRDVETFIRDAIAGAFPDDGIVGEEQARKAGSSGHDWVIDPIDGTANFVRGIPQWCVVIACVTPAGTVLGVINEPVSGELFHAARGTGAFLNGQPMRAVGTDDIGTGSIGTGFSGRAPAGNVVKVIDRIVGEGGVFFRNASGALMLAYVAAGRLLGYIEEHMNSWDCLAGLLIIEEAGGRIVTPDPHTVLENGTVAVAAGSNFFPHLLEIAEASFEPGVMPRSAQAPAQGK